MYETLFKAFHIFTKKTGYSHCPSMYGVKVLVFRIVKYFIWHILFTQNDKICNKKVEIRLLCLPEVYKCVKFSQQKKIFQFND